MSSKPYIGTMAVTEDCCQHVLHSSTEQQGMNFVLKSAAVDDCLVTVHLYVQQTFIGTMAVTEDCCQHVLHSSTEQQGMNFVLKSAAVDDFLVTVHPYVQQTF